MIPFLVAIETVVLAAVVWTLARRAPAAGASGGRLLAIAGLLAAQVLLIDACMLRLLPALWREGQGTPAGLIWLVQAARASLLVPAFALWYRLTRDDLTGRGQRGLLAVALLAIAFGGGPLPVLAIAVLLWLTGRSGWSRELSGWRRFSTLIAAPLLLVAIGMVPSALVSEGTLNIRFAPFVQPWQAPVVSGAPPPALALELALTRPLDRLVQCLLDLFRAQLLVLAVRALTMPMRLYGTSLKRRFVVNYIFVRSIPSTLAFLTLLAVGYVAFGVHQAGRARGEFERVLARADAASAALLDRLRAARGKTEIDAALESARDWLGPAGGRAHVVLHRWEGAPRHQLATTATIGTPSALTQLRPPATPDGRVEGVVEGGDALFLLARRVAPDSSQILDVFVPLDSTLLAAVAEGIGARLALRLDRGFASGRSQVSFSPDTSGRRSIRVRSHAAGGRRREAFFLGRSYLPLGDWRRGWREDAQGAVVLELTTTMKLLLATVINLPGWLVSNVVMVGLLLVLTMLIGTVEGIAVRSGRGIVKSIEDEVAAMQQAVTRFGAGELDHRLPVRGRDEFSVLAASFNDMAANLQRQRGELIEKERLEEDLEVARSIQRRFLPQGPPAVPGLEVAGISVPSREVGGDLYHYVELPEGRLGVALGDVSGKSVPAALIMSNVMSALRAEAQHEAEIEKSLGRINRLLVEQIEPGRFVTLFYGVFDPAAGAMRYTSAGHNPVLRISDAGEVSWLREGGVPLGVVAATAYPGTQVPLERGDLVVAYSDGVTEAEGPDRDGRPELFGEARLAEVVGRLRSRPVEAIVAGVLEAVKGFAAGRPQADDITLVVVRRQ